MRSRLDLKTVVLNLDLPNGRRQKDFVWYLRLCCVSPRLGPGNIGIMIRVMILRFQKFKKPRLFGDDCTPNAKNSGVICLFLG